ncbi:hypothetical protein [Sphingomonas bisphenolicum]|uniref:Uncharacterized protein n=1 Tax=Sphingomonas bisphenolicum TaxID=296544 RepID=A0ABM7G8N1_9SPHN|nr:hypothetical protein [Sphingomonas bisphenolicum]BBF72038.1 hypothetical protein SBA_ch2_5710 [Sphingomonas bisphenolicum]
MGMTQELWLAPAAVQLQESGPDWLDVVDDKDWSNGGGFHRGFSSSFRVRPERKVWFHFPFQLPTGGVVDQVSLLWETEEGACISWVCVHHGGMHRQHVCEPNTPLTGTPEPFDPPELWRQFYPASNRLRTDLPVAPVIETRFGFQLCVQVDGPGVVRFYGAGLRFTASGG